MNSRYLITINGETKHLVSWARTFNIDTAVARARFNKNWPVEKLFIEPLRYQNDNLWDVINLKLPKIKSKYEISRIESFVKSTLAIERRNVNKKKYKEVRRLIEDCELQYEDRIGKMIEARIGKLEQSLNEYLSRLSDLEDKVKDITHFRNEMRVVY